MSIDWWMNKEIVVPAYDGLLLNCIEEEIINMLKNMGESQKHVQ